MTKPTRATPESGSTPLSSRVDPILTPAKAEREAAANRSVDTSDTLKQTVTKATPSVSDETLALFGRRNDFATRYHLTRRGKIKRLGQITRIVEQFDVLHGLTPVKMRLMFEALGPTFVKVGQILSMRSEILPQSFCDELAKLRADADPMPYSTVLDVLAAEYGRPADEVFAHIDPKPLGSASLAQVHRATLKTGEDVAIKVQRPGVRETMAQDVSIMRSIAKAATKVIRTSQIVDLKGVVEELWDTFESETDFLIEARNLAEFKRFAARFKYMDCPTAYTELCTEHVVVMEYIDGISVSHPGRLVDAGYDLKEIGTKLVDNYATQILDDGFFHADPHPGNIEIKDGCIVYLDLGNMGRLTPDERASFMRIIVAVGHESSTMLEDALIGFSVGGDVNAIDHPRLLSTLDRIIDRYASAEMDEIDIGAFLTDITNAMRECKLELPSCLTAVARGLVTLEGTLINFVGSFNMVDVINGHLSREKTPMDEFKQMTHDLIISLDRSARGLARATEYIGDVTHMLSRGQLKVNMEMLSSQEPLGKLSRIINRLTLGMITAGTLVSAALVSTISEPTVAGLPVLSFTGYCVGIGLTLWIIIDIIRHGGNNA